MRKILSVGLKVWREKRHTKKRKHEIVNKKEENVSLLNQLYKA